MKSNKAVSLLLAGVLLVGSVVQPAQAETISSAKKKAQKLEEQKKKAEQEQSSLSGQLNTIIADMQKAEADVQAKGIEIAEAEDELIEAKAKENTQYERMKIRIKYMYENGNADMIAVLLTAEDMGDFLNKAEYVEQISSYDRQMLVEFQKVVKEVAEKEAALKIEREKLIELQDTLEAKHQEVEKLLASKKMEVSNLEAEIGENAKVLNDLIAKAKEAERRKKEAAAAKAAAEKAAADKNKGDGGKGNGGNSGNNGGGSRPPVISGSGVLSNPCPGGRITSEFGGRNSPGGVGSTNHKGRDYGAPTGTPIYAAASGTVITVSDNYYRGNYVVINHPSLGLKTYYQHMSSISVYEGQQVGKGTYIGGVGDTGISTGPHLHFEVHTGRGPQDPRDFL